MDICPVNEAWFHGVELARTKLEEAREASEKAKGAGTDSTLKELEARGVKEHGHGVWKKRAY